MCRTLFLFCLLVTSTPAVTLIDDNDLNEDWNFAADWEDTQPPSSTKDYVVDGAVAGILRSPASGSPVFAGRALSLQGPNARLVLNHSGTATLDDLSMSEAILVAGADTALGGSRLAISNANGIQLENGAWLELRSPIQGAGSIEVLGTFAEDGTTSGGLRLTGAGSDHAVDWILNGAGLHAVVPGSLGAGDITLIRGRLDFDYHVSAPQSVLRIEGEGCHLELDRQWVFGGLAVVANGDVIFELPPGSYSAEDLVNDIGFTFEMVSGTGTLTIVDETSDSDGDGLLDEWEITHLGTLDENGDDDGDDDELTNAEEFALATDPRNDDSDGDGLKDGTETRTGFFVSALNTGSDPAQADSDGDGLGDGEEVNQYGSSPVATDTDGDGLSDTEEISEHGTSPNNADTDGDGNDDRSELLVGTDPNDAGSSFTRLEIGAVGFEEAPLGARNHSGGEELGWNAEPLAGSPMTVDALDSVTLPDRQLLLHNGAMVWRSAIVSLAAFTHPTVGIDARIYQTSTGIENDDHIDLKIALSTDGGLNFSEELVLLQVEGTRTGAGAEGRLPLEEVFALDAPADGPFVRFQTSFGQIPEGVTHLQVIIDASNNSTSERFLFDNIVVEGVAQVDPDLDSDGDGLSDLVELQHGLDPNNAADVNADLDDDGLSNGDEISAGTRVTVADTDGDGLGDGDEVHTHGTDPLRADSDGDGLSDGQELTVHATNPNSADTDGDGYGDALELRFGSDPTVADTVPPFGPPSAAGFVWFEESAPGDTSFTAENSAETSWAVAGQGVDGGVIDTLDGAALPSHQLYIHGGSLTFVTDPIAVTQSEDVVVTADARIYQTSSGIESNDYIDIFVQGSADGGVTFAEPIILLSVEGTRTGASGGPRTPLEDMFPVDGPADGPFVSVSNARGALPAGLTHVRVVIDAQNNSTSERFIFDNITVREQPNFAPGQDSDNDGMPDAWEFEHGFDSTAAADANMDADGDGLTNVEEYALSTNPRNSDSDDDGLTDFQEVNETLTDPAASDTDGDGLSDGEELLVTKTDPLLRDTDGDGIDDRTEIVFNRDPLTATPAEDFGPEGALAFTSFEQAIPGDLAFTGTGIEMGWQTEATGDTAVVSQLAGVGLPNQAMVIHNGSLTFISDAVAIGDPASAVISVDARVYQESTGIESEDFIDLRFQISSDGINFEDAPPFLALEGTRTGPGGGGRLPLEDFLDVTAPADGDFVTLSSKPGDVPAGTTHVRVVIAAENNSDSEHFIFDNVVVRGDGVADPPVLGDAAPRIVGVRYDRQEGVTLTWDGLLQRVYRVEYQPALIGANGWISLADVPAQGGTGTFTHEAAAGQAMGFYRVGILPEG